MSDRSSETREQQLEALRERFFGIDDGYAVEILGVLAPWLPEEEQPWEPLRQVPIAEDAQAAATKVGEPIFEVWVSDLYECQVRLQDDERLRAGPLWLSIKRMDRGPDRNWRHLQAIKNEVAGWEREGFELFPAESRLVDAANQTHLWVMGAGDGVPAGFRDRDVRTQDEMVEELVKLGLDPSKGRQRPWQPGISTGPEYRS